MPAKERDDDFIMNEDEEIGLFAAAFEKKHPMKSNLLPTKDQERSDKKRRVEDTNEAHDSLHQGLGNSNISTVSPPINHELQNLIVEPPSETFTASDVTMSGSLGPPPPEGDSVTNQMDDTYQTNDVIPVPPAIIRTGSF